MDEEYQKKLHDQDLKRFCVEKALQLAISGHIAPEDYLVEAKGIYAYITD